MNDTLSYLLVYGVSLFGIWLLAWALVHYMTRDQGGRWQPSPIGASLNYHVWVLYRREFSDSAPRLFESVGAGLCVYDAALRAEVEEMTGDGVLSDEALECAKEFWCLRQVRVER